MCYMLSQLLTGILLFFCMTHYDHSYSDISVYATSYNSSEEIKNIFSLSHANSSIFKGGGVTGNYAEGGLIDESLNQSGSKALIKKPIKNLSNSHKNLSKFSDFLNRQNISSSFSNATKNNSYNSLPTSSVKALLPNKLIETGSNLFLGVPEVIHVNGTSSIKPRKGVHYSKIVPRKGVENENEAIHFSLESQSCFRLSEKECYTNKESNDLECSCCKESNALGKNVMQTPVNCTNCKTFTVLSSEEIQTCKNICCDAFNVNLNSESSTQNIYDSYLHYQTESTTEKRQHNFYMNETTKKVMLPSDAPKNIVTDKNNNSVSLRKNSKPLITKVPYDTESMTELLGKTEQKVFVPLAVSLFLLPLLGIIIFFLWQRAKEYWNKRYYKRMDFLIDGIYND